MWRSYLLLSIRNLWKHRVFTFINITGLSIGFAFAILIFLYITDELSYDTFHSKSDQIFRIEEVRHEYGDIKSMFDLDGDGITQTAWLPTPLGPTMKSEISGISNFTRYDGGEVIFSHGDKIFQEKITFVDPGFFNMFDFKVSPASDLNTLFEKHHIIITDKISKKYFGEENPIGKSIDLDIYGNKKQFIVNGIIESPPANSSVNFENLIHQENKPYYQENFENWRSFNTPVFVELSPGINRSDLKESMASFKEKYFGEEIKESRIQMNIPDDLPVFDLALNPLANIHLDKNVAWEKVSDPLYTYILGCIGLLIIIIACINYISISLSTATGRTKEVGVRKVMGANPKELASQFWGESQILVVCALLTGILLAALFITPFNDFSGKSLSIMNQESILFYLFLLAISLLVGLFAGGYPAVYLSRFKAVDVLKSNSTNRYNPFITRFMVIIQYVLSGFLIISSLIMYQQMHFITGKDLGYNKEQVLVIPTYTGYSDEGEKVVNQMFQSLNSIPEVLYTGGTSASFNKGWSRNSYEIDEKFHAAFTYRVDDFYEKILELDILKGRNFEKGRLSDETSGILVNEALIEEFGWENPVGEKLYWRDDSLASEIIGVVKNYHFLSLESTIDPLILYQNPKVGKMTTVLVKIIPENIPQTLSKVEKAWKTLYPDKPFEFSFLDEDVSNQYFSYIRWMKIMTTSTFLAIFIACLGLFGLAGINALNRTKEISIRKVLGADLKQIFILMNKDVVLLAVMSFVIATPVSFYVMNKWLDSFVYKIQIGWPIIIMAIISGVIIALLTVSYHTIKTALVNPAEILKNE